MHNAYKNFPWESTVWLPRLNYTICPAMEVYSFIMYQAIPGFMFDAILKITKSKKRFVKHIIVIWCSF